MISLLTPEERAALEQRREQHNGDLRKVGASKRWKHGSGAFRGNGKRTFPQSAAGYMAKCRKEAPRGAVALGAGKEIEHLTRRMNATGGGKSAVRALVCAEHGVPNTGRQWRKIRKAGGHLRTDIKRRRAQNQKRRRP